MNKLYLLVFVLSGLISCQKEISIDVPKHTSLLTGHCLFSSDSLFRVLVSNSRGILEEGFIGPMTGANVSLYENGVLLEQLTVDSLGSYKSSAAKPVTGRNYTLLISAPGYETIEAASSLPEKVPVLASFRDSASYDDGGGLEAEIILDFDDPPGKNFYEIRVAFRDTVVVDSMYIPSGSAPVYSVDPVVEQYNNVLLVKDESFNGNHATLQIKMASAYGEPRKFTLHFRSVTEDYYKYSRSYQLHQLSGGNPFAEPVQVYGNFKNGFGIFAGYEEQKIILR